jgi:hypothetical protein
MVRAALIYATLVEVLIRGGNDVALVERVVVIVVVVLVVVVAALVLVVVVVKVAELEVLVDHLEKSI